MKNCSPLQQSLAWCMGTPELPGIRRRIYYIAKSQIAKWPSFVRDANYRTKAPTLRGNFLLVADAKWKFIDILADKSQLTSEAQGEIPSQTQLNKLVAVHPGVGPEATAAACYLNNSDNVFIVEDMKGLFRVVGSDRWITKTTVSQDNGQGPTGTTSTTINVEATDEVPAPFYTGLIATDDGDIECAESFEGVIPEDDNSGSSGSGNSNTGGNSGGGTSANTGAQVVANGSTYTVSKGGAVTVIGPLTSLSVTGSNISYMGLKNGTGMEEEINVQNRTTGSWSGNIAAPATVRIIRDNGNIDDPEHYTWFTINVSAAGNGGGESDE